jgi:hypothetical protein
VLQDGSWELSHAATEFVVEPSNLSLAQTGSETDRYSAFTSQGVGDVMFSTSDAQGAGIDSNPPQHFFTNNRSEPDYIRGDPEIWDEMAMSD